MIGSSARIEPNISRNGKDIPSFFQCEVGGNKSTAPFCRLHHKDTPAHSRDNPVPRGELPPQRRRPRRVFRNNRAAIINDFLEQIFIFRRIYMIQPAGKRHHRRAFSAQCPFMRSAVDSSCAAGNHRHSIFGQTAGYPFCRLQTIRRRFPRAYNRHRLLKNGIISFIK